MLKLFLKLENLEGYKPVVSKGTWGLWLHILYAPVVFEILKGIFLNHKIWNIKRLHLDFEIL